MNATDKWVYITAENANQYAVFSCLQRGVLMEMHEKTNVLTFICTVLNIDLPTFRREVKTILLNHGVVDDPGATSLATGDILVISGAMPGLVGAMLRSDSPIKALRERITAIGVQSNRSTPESMIIVKFFNTILRNHRQDILNYGFYIDKESNEPN